ncbi:MAG: helix-turn-helix transcriptional regulator, partial [Pseudomonadota bacterium]
RANRLGDEGISRFLLSHLDTELSDLPPADTVVTQARAAIANALSEGVPKMAEVARGLGLSSRSFHRRLAEHDVGFQALIESTQRELAEGLLREDDHSLADIAFLTGFSEQSAFSRAFKRWSGVTPARFRREHRVVPR